MKQILFRIAETIASRVTWPVLIENSPVRSHETALQYVEHLQDAFLCVIHYCYDNNTKGPAFQKARKLFFVDPLVYAVAATWRDGIPNIFDWMKQKLQQSDFKGKLLKSVVVNHVSRIYDHVKLQPSQIVKAMGKEVKILHPEEFLNKIGKLTSKDKF